MENKKVSNTYVYLLLTYTGSVLSSVIRRLSDYPYSHIAIGIDNSYQTFYSFGRKYFSNPLIAGFVSEDVKEGVYMKFQNTEFRLYRLEVSMNQLETIQIVLDEFEENKRSYRYNFLGLVTAKAGVPFERNNSYFCSEFASEVLERAEIFDFEKPKGLLHPMDFLEIPNLELMAEGQLSDFRKDTWDIITPDNTLMNKIVNIRNRVNIF